MSWATCYNGSNNIHFDFPAIMADGRTFATWQPGAKVNKQIREENNIKSNWEYRKYLTNNADSIIKSNQLAACDNCCYCPAEYNSQSTSNSPFLYKSSGSKLDEVNTNILYFLNKTKTFFINKASTILKICNSSINKRLFSFAIFLI